MSALKYVAIALLLALPSKCKMSSYVPWSPIPSAANEHDDHQPERGRRVGLAGLGA